MDSTCISTGMYHVVLILKTVSYVVIYVTLFTEIDRNSKYSAVMTLMIYIGIVMYLFLNDACNI